MNKTMIHKERLIDSLTESINAENQEKLNEVIHELKLYDIEDWILQLIENKKLLSCVKVYGEDNIVSIGINRPIYIRKYLNKFVLDMSYDKIYHLHEYAKTINTMHELESFIHNLIRDTQ